MPIADSAKPTPASIQVLDHSAYRARMRAFSGSNADMGRSVRNFRRMRAILAHWRLLWVPKTPMGTNKMPGELSRILFKSRRDAAE
jgi:hypothetical protein